MHVSLRSLLIVAGLAVVVPSSAHAATTRTGASSSQLLVEVDGVFAGAVTEWTGGDPILSYSGSTESHPNVGAAPLELTLPIPLQAGFERLVREFLAGEHHSHTLRLTETSAGKGEESLRADNAVVTGLRVVSFDARNAKASPPALILELQPASSRSESDLSVPRVVVPAKGGASNFSFSFSGSTGTSSPDGRFISGYEEIVIRSKDGAQPRPERLLIRFSPARASMFRGWRDAAAAGSRSASQRDLTLGFLDASMRRTLLSLVFKDSVPVRVSRSADNDNMELELSARSVVLAGETSSPSGSAPASKETLADPHPEPSAPVTPATESAAEPTPGLAPGDRTLKPISRTPVPSRSDKLLMAEGDDQGLRDPRDFPRPAGLVRLNFTFSDYITSSTDQANYTGKRPLQELLDEYVAVLDKEGWSKTGGSDSGASPETRMVLTSWQKGRSKADLRLYATKDGCNVSLLVEYRP